MLGGLAHGRTSCPEMAPSEIELVAGPLHLRLTTHFWVEVW